MDQKRQKLLGVLLMMVVAGLWKLSHTYSPTAMRFEARLMGSRIADAQPLSACLFSNADGVIPFACGEEVFIKGNEVCSRKYTSFTRDEDVLCLDFDNFLFFRVRKNGEIL